MDKSTKKLLQKAIGRDPDAFTELMQLQMEGMYRTAYAILLNDADAADAIQETLLTLWEKMGTLKKPEFFRTWYTRILMNRCFDLRRKRVTVIPLEEWDEPTVEDDYNIEWREALQGIDEKYRIVLELFYGQGYRTSEIAGMLDIPDSTVRTRLARGREQMKRYYQD